jgi:hypothetical protein
MAKEWANKDRYHPFHGVPEPRMPLPKGKGFVRKDPAWGDEKSHSCGGGLERAVRPAWLGGQTGPPQFSGSSVFEVVMLVVSVLLVMVQMVDTLSLVVLILLDVLHPVINTSLGEVTTLSIRGAMDHAFFFVVLVLL